MRLFAYALRWRLGPESRRNSLPDSFWAVSTPAALRPPTPLPLQPKPPASSAPTGVVVLRCNIHAITIDDVLVKVPDYLLPPTSRNSYSNTDGASETTTSSTSTSSSASAVLGRRFLATEVVMHAYTLGKQLQLIADEHGGSCLIFFFVQCSF